MPNNITPQKYHVKHSQREDANRHEGKVIWFSGLSGSGKSTLANLLERDLFKRGFKTYVLDGDNIRSGLNYDLGFSDQDRKENLRRVAEVAKLFADAGMIVLVAFITPLDSYRKMIRQIIGPKDLINVYVSCSLDICEQRDTKGLYARARKGEIKSFTGIDAPFEPPKNCDLVLDTGKDTQQTCLNKLVSLTLQQVNNDL